MNPGNSGGPVLDSQGDVTCLVTLRASLVEGIALGIPAVEIERALRASQDVAEAEAKRLGALHDARTVYRRLMQISLLHLACLQSNLESIARARSRGRNPVRSLLARHGEYAEALTKATTQLERGLPWYVSVLGEGDALTKDQKLALNEFVGWLRELETSVLHPSGTIEAYVKKHEAVGDEFRRHASRLATALGIEE